MKNSLQSKIENWLDERYDLSPIRKLITHKKVPLHKHSVWYYMGGAALFLFIIQVITGTMLLLYYKPGEESAYESVRFIITKVKFGWLIRNVHSWSANLMVFFVFLHMFSVFFMKAYKKPRELTWVTGFLLLGIAMGFGFSGYLLPWNELAFFATKVGTDIVGVIPIVGEEIKLMLRGGEDVTGATLSRFFGIHVAVMPAIFMMILGLHLFFVQKQGMHEPEGFSKLPDEKKKYIPFFPNFMLKDATLWLVIFALLSFLALYFPWELGPKADPFLPAPEGIKPEWYFLFTFQTLKYLPSHVLFMDGELFGILFFNVAGLIWMLIPFLAIKDRPGWKIQPMTVIGILVLIFMIAMTVLGFIT